MQRSPVVAVPEAFAGVFPESGLAKGSVASYTGSATVLAGLLAAATGAGTWLGRVGGHRHGMLAVHEMGGRLNGSRSSVTRAPTRSPW